MAFVNKKGKQLVIALSIKESKESGLEEGKRYNLVKQGSNWILSEAVNEEKQKKQAVLEQKILGMLKKASLSERVEGKFEKMLDKEELPVFKKMLEEEKVIPFKLSEKYKKAVYKLATEKVKGAEQSNAKEKGIEEYDLEKDGIMIIKNEHRAKKISEQFKKEIQENKIKGTKSFDGYFYIIDSDLYNKYRAKLLQVIKASKEISLEELYNKINVSKILCKIVAEFLKEEGEIIEKTKEKYCYIA